MTKTSNFTWDKEAARALLTEFENFWSQSPEKYGITARPRADTQLKTSRSLFGLMQGHGKRGRKQDLFYGAGDIWEDLVEISQDNLILDDELAEFKFFLRALDKIEDSDRDPRNIVFNTVVSFDEKSGESKRDEVRGHFLTQAYWGFRKNKAGKNDESYDVAKPDPEWVSLQGEKNKAKPPLWAIIFGKTNSLRTLIKEIEALAREPINPPIAHLDLKISSGKAGQLANVPAIQAAVRNVLSRADIFPTGKSRAPTKSKLNDAMAEQSIAVSEEVMNLIAPEATVLVENDGRIIRRNLKEFPDFKGIKSVTLNFPRNNIVLNKLIREVLGDEMGSFERPNRAEDGPLGLVLKAEEADLIREATSILKNVKLNLGDEDREEDSLLEDDPELHNPNILGYTRPDGEEKIRVNLDHILSNAIQEESLENFGMFLRLMRNEGTPEEAKQFADNVDERSYNRLIEVLRHESIHLAQIYGGVSEDAGGGEEYTDLTQAVLLGPMMGNITPQEITHLMMAYFRAYAYHFIYMELPAYWAEGDKTWDEAKEHIKQIWQLQTKFRQTLVNLNEAFLDNYEMPWLEDDTLEDLMRRFNVLFAEIVDAMGDRNAS